MKRMGLDSGLIRTWLIVVFCLSAWSPATSQDDYSFEPGDCVRITLFGQEDLSHEVEVPLHLLDNPLIEKQDNVEIVPCGNEDFYIIGGVFNPGPYPFVEGMRVINAIAMAAGFTYLAKDQCFFITRDGKRKCVGPETPVMPGDIIEVPERFFF